MTFLAAYRDVLSLRATRRLAVAAVATRLPPMILNLSVLLAVQSIRGSLASAALVWTGYALSFALCQPFLSRLMDRSHGNAVLLGALTVHLLGYGALLLALSARATTAVLVAFAVLMGASTPAAGPLIRASWPAVVDADRVRTAFALDAVIAEGAYVVGPLIVTGIVAFAPPVVAVMAAGICMTMGVLVLLRTRGAVNASRAASAPGRRMSLMPVTHGGVRTILLMVAFHIFAAGCFSIALVGAATEHHQRGAAGILLSVLSCGVVAGGIAFGARPWPGDTRSQLVATYGITALILVAAGFASFLVALGLLMLLVGLVGGAIDTLLQLALGDAAPQESRTEAFAWLGTVTWASTAAGTAVGGQLVAIGDVGPSVALLVGAVAMAVAALWATRIPGGAGTVIGTSAVETGD